MQYIRHMVEDDKTAATSFWTSLSRGTALVLNSPKSRIITYQTIKEAVFLIPRFQSETTQLTIVETNTA